MLIYLIDIYFLGNYNCENILMLELNGLHTYSIRFLVAHYASQLTNTGLSLIQSKIQ